MPLVPRIASHRRVLGFLALVAACRLLLAALLNLGNDEVYYANVYAHEFSLAYFDHPPMVGWLIRLCTAGLSIPADALVRLPAVLCGGLTAWFVYLAAERLGGQKAGWAALWLHTASVYTSIIAGVFVLPDSPLLACWAWAIYLALGLTQNGTAGWRPWLLFGLAVGLGLLSKVSAAYLWVGMGLFALWQRPQWWFNPRFYAAGLLSALFLLPVLVWNVQNDFVTYQFHSGRVNGWNHLQLDSFLREWLGNIAYANPVFYAALIWALGACWRQRKQLRPEHRLLICLGLPLLAFFQVISIFRDTLPHWSGPGYLSLWVLTAWVLDRRIKPFLRWGRRLLYGLLLAALGLIFFFPGTLGSKDNVQMGLGDFTLDLWGWNHLPKAMNTAFAGKAYPLHWPLIVTKWFPASHLDFYWARGENRRLHLQGSVQELHHFAWMKDRLQPLLHGDTALYVLPSHLADQSALEELRSQFQSVVCDTLVQQRMGQTARQFFVYRLQGAKAGQASVSAP